jgi:hypothetical protein
MSPDEKQESHKACFLHSSSGDGEERKGTEGEAEEGWGKWRPTWLLSTFFVDWEESMLKSPQISLMAKRGLSGGRSQKSTNGCLLRG